MIEIIRSHPTGFVLAVLLLLALACAGLMLFKAALEFLIWIIPKADAWALAIVGKVGGQ